MMGLGFVRAASLCSPTCIQANAHLSAPSDLLLEKKNNHVVDRENVIRSKLNRITTE